MSRETALLVAVCILAALVALLSWRNVALYERSRRWEEWFWGHVDLSRRDQERRNRR